MVTVELPWNIEPDASSVINIQQGGHKWTVVNSCFDGTQRVADPVATNHNQTAACGVSHYGGFQYSIVHNNLMTDLRYGLDVYNYGDTENEQHSDFEEHVQPAYFNTYSDNMILNSTYGTHFSIAGIDTTDVADVGAFGSIFQNNTTSNINDTAHWNAGQDTTLRTELLVYEHNFDYGAPVNISVDLGYNTYTNGNTSE